MDRRTFIGAVGTATTVGFAGCLGSGEPVGEHDIGMSIDSFRPAELRVEPGTTVQWGNTSTHTHTVTAFDDGIPDEAEYFASGGYGNRETAREAWHESRGGGLIQGDTFEHTFEIPGEYEYYCIPHIRADMVGTVIVEE